MAHAKDQLFDKIRHLVDVLEPVDALEMISAAARDLLRQLDADTRAAYILNLLHDNRNDKTASLVHL